ncbi:MAG: sulfurtransferase [Gemmatimonadaceae bacterium]|nr:sulfurtransferase [Gemmatimonadaceae bacterium]
MSRVSRYQRVRARCATAATFALFAVACRHGSAVPVAGAQTRSQMLVTTTWLAEHASDANLVVLHVGNKAQYDSGHAPGARLVTLAELSLPQVEGGLTLQMGTVAQLAAWATANGIGDKSRVVVVPHDENLQSATRVFITLAYLGAFERTSVLDGGFKAWKAEGRAVTKAAPSAASAVTFTPRPRPELIATLAQVEAISKDSGRTALIDARLPRFYNGDGGGYPRPGHIPTAVNIPLNTVSTNGFMKPASELKTLLAQAGVKGDKPIVTYCHIGQQATVLWFVATLLGYDARMFDGSFQEWSSTTRLPVVAPPPKE